MSDIFDFNDGEGPVPAHRHENGGGMNRPAMVSSGVEAIALERRRQIDVEGWSSEHDDTHKEHQLAAAAASYAWAVVEPDEEGWRPPYGWPWAGHWWKPTGKRQMLVKAGALIAAEIDRLDRATSREKG